MTAIAGGKPTESPMDAKADEYTPPKQVFVLEQSLELRSLMTIIRDRETCRGDFIFYSDRVIRLLVEEGL